MIDRLCVESFPLEDCRDLSVAVGANHVVGTDMQILAPVVAERFHLQLQTTDDLAQMADCLQNGGAAVINVGGNREGYTGTFSDGGHYLVALRESRGEFCLLDPSWTPQKYREAPRCDRVRQRGRFLYTPADILRQDTASRSPAYYLFSRMSFGKTSLG